MIISVSMIIQFQHIQLADFDISNITGLKIGNLNVNSLTKHINEIRILLAEILFHILSINGSKIDGLQSDSEIFTHNYTLLRHDRNRQGVVWLYTSEITFHIL